MAYQTTLAGPAVCAGIGLHTGARAKLVLKPGEPDSGIVFVRTDITDRDNRVVACGLNVATTQLGTTLTNDAGVSVSTVEHLMAACAGVGLDNLIVEIDGPEIPIMDGSSALYCRLLLQSGLSRQARPRRRIRVLKPVEVRDGDKYARLSPARRKGDPMDLRVRIDFDNAAIGEQTYAFRLTPGAFVEHLAFARTFGFARDVEKLQSMGLARGGSLDNAVVLDGENVLNPEGLRSADEFVRHKMLDAIGDLFLAGGFIEGAFDGDQPGHALNNRLVRALLQSDDAWEWVSDTSESLSAASMRGEAAACL